MGKKDPRVDAYIAKSADFAKPILNYLRDVVHEACPEVEEDYKWSFPHFSYKGMFCSMAAFKQHCAFGFWKGSLVVGKDAENGDQAAGQFGRITKLSELPPKKVLTGYIKLAKKLNDDGVKPPSRVKPKARRGAGCSGRPGQGAQAQQSGPDDLREVQSQQQARIRGLDHRGQDRGHPKQAARDGHRMDGRGEDAELEVHELLAKGLGVTAWSGIERAAERQERRLHAEPGNEGISLLRDRCDGWRFWMGKPLAEKVRRQIAVEAAAFTAETGVVPGLTVVLVGEDPASQVYVRNKAAACKAAGMNGHVLRLPVSTSQAELLATIERLNADQTVHGILVQLPLPRQIDESVVVERVAPTKDVDGFHPVNFGLLAAGSRGFVPCTPLGIRELLLDAGIETRGAHAVILGRSRIVGRPLAFLLLQKAPGGRRP